MASKRRKGRPRKSGHRYRNGNLRPSSHEPAVSPAAVAATQPHRQGLGDRAADQKAESELGRMALRGQISALQYLAGQRYAAQWRVYLATLDGPRSPQRGHGRGNGCSQCDPPRACACELAKRAWTRSTLALDREAVVIVARVACWDVPCPAWGLSTLITGLNALAESLGLTTGYKSGRCGNASSPRTSAHAEPPTI
jgi:hypothetical protein